MPRSTPTPAPRNSGPPPTANRFFVTEPTLGSANEGEVLWSGNRQRSASSWQSIPDSCVGADDLLSSQEQNTEQAPSWESG